MSSNFPVDLFKLPGRELSLQELPFLEADEFDLFLLKADADKFCLSWENDGVTYSELCLVSLDCSLILISDATITISL